MLVLNLTLKMFIKQPYLYINMVEVQSRIERLLANQDLGSKEIIPRIRPNCYGTTLYVLGLDQELLELYQRLIIRDIDPASLLTLSPEDRPNYVGSLLMEIFLQSGRFTLVEEAIPEEIITFSWVLGRDDTPCMSHSGVYLAEDQMFHQHNSGGPFCHTSIKKFLDLEYGERKSKIKQAYFRTL